MQAVAHKTTAAHKAKPYLFHRSNYGWPVKLRAHQTETLPVRSGRTDGRSLTGAPWERRGRWLVRMSRSFDTRLVVQSLLVSASIFAVYGFSPDTSGEDPMVQHKLYSHLDYAERALEGVQEMVEELDEAEGETEAAREGAAVSR